LKSSVTRVLKEELGPDAVIKEIKVQQKITVAKEIKQHDKILPDVKTLSQFLPVKGASVNRLLQSIWL